MEQCQGALLHSLTWKSSLGKGMTDEEAQAGAQRQP